MAKTKTSSSVVNTEAETEQVVLETSVPLAADGDQTISSLQDLIVNANDGETVYLSTLTDEDTFKGAGVATFLADGSSNKSFTIDFCNKTFICTGPYVGSSGTPTQVFHFEQNSDKNGPKITLKNGTVKVEEPTAKVGMVIQNYADLTLENMILDGSGLSGTSSFYTVSNNCGDTNINNCKIIAKQDTDKTTYALDACGYASYNGVSVSVTNTEITGNVKISKSPNNDKGIGITLGSGTSVTGEVKLDASVNQDTNLTVVNKTNTVIKQKSSDGSETQVWFDDSGKNPSTENPSKGDGVGVPSQQYLAAAAAALNARRLREQYAYWQMTNRR